MNNHWHLVLSPEIDGEMSRFMRWISATHTMRYHAHYHSSGEGHVYQGRFKSFPIQGDAHFLTVCRYVERNALQAGMVRHAEDWRWGSLYRWLQNTEPDPKLLAPWPINRSPNWLARVNESLTRNEVEAIRHSIKRSKPYGDESWIATTAKRLDLESTLRPRGRPRIDCEESRNNES
jgi:putative transposase